MCTENRIDFSEFGSSVAKVNVLVIVLNRLVGFKLPHCTTLCHNGLFGAKVNVQQ